MNTSRARLPMVAWTTSLLAAAAAWGATVTDSPWNILLVIFAVLGIMTAAATIAILVARIKAESGEDGSL